MERPALYVVATPIGNRADLSERAADTLRAVDRIAAEDTRVSGPFLRDLGASAPLVSLHEHNELDRIPVLLDRLGQGEAVALVSDAGTPLISDPGFALVRAVRDVGHPVYTVPGACAVIAALSISGLPTDQFRFAGFVAPKAAGRRRQMAQLTGTPATLVFYASKRQLGDALAAAAEVLGESRSAVIARELTKLHETVHTGTLAELAQLWPDIEQRGEWVLLIEGASDVQADAAETRRVMSLLLERVSLKDAAALTARVLGVPKREAYAIGLSLSKDG
ncbi:MAG: 16S rRNA (cytidine(1402)-2'-O)-methyltransferase [Pseudomonadota bacterium]